MFLFVIFRLDWLRHTWRIYFVHLLSCISIFCILVLRCCAFLAYPLSRLSNLSSSCYLPHSLLEATTKHHHSALAFRNFSALHTAPHPWTSKFRALFFPFRLSSLDWILFRSRISFISGRTASKRPYAVSQRNFYLIIQCLAMSVSALGHFLLFSSIHSHPHAANTMRNKFYPISLFISYKFG